MVERQLENWEVSDAWGEEPIVSLNPVLLARHLRRSFAVSIQLPFKNGDVERCRGVLAGNVKNELLLVEMLSTADLLVGDLVQVRMAWGPQLGTFETRIAKLMKEPRLCFLEFPENVHLVNLRRTPRLTVFFPAEAELTGAGISGTRVLKVRMMDLSAGGCSLRSRAEIPEDAQVRVAFMLPGDLTVNTLKAKVIDCELMGRTFQTRIKFLQDPGTAPTLKEIAKWVDEGLSYAG